MPNKKLTKEVEHAIKWLAAEFKFLKKLHEDLEKIEKEELKEQEKDLKKDLRVVRYIGRAERRAEKDIKDILEEIKKAEKEETTHEKLGKIFKEIEVPAAQLLKEGSLYVGNLRGQIKTIRTDAALAKKYPKEETRAAIQKEINNLESKVIRLLDWIATLEVGLKKAESFLEEQKKKAKFKLTKEDILSKSKEGYITGGLAFDACMTYRYRSHTLAWLKSAKSKKPCKYTLETNALLFIPMNKGRYKGEQIRGSGPRSWITYVYSKITHLEEKFEKFLRDWEALLKPKNIPQLYERVKDLYSSEELERLTGWTYKYLDQIKEMPSFPLNLRILIASDDERQEIINTLELKAEIEGELMNTFLGEIVNYVKENPADSEEILKYFKERMAGYRTLKDKKGKLRYPSDFGKDFIVLYKSKLKRKIK